MLYQDYVKRSSENLAMKFESDMSIYSDENIQVISNFLYHCVQHGWLELCPQNPICRFVSDVKSGKFDDVDADQYKMEFIKMKQLDRLWSHYEHITVKDVMTNIFKMCPKDKALVFIGELVRYMINPDVWAVDTDVLDSISLTVGD